MVPDCPTAEGSVNGSLTDQHCTLSGLSPALLYLPSARLLERAGFHYEGTARECERKGDGFISLRHYAILRSDLPASL